MGWENFSSYGTYEEIAHKRMLEKYPGNAFIYRILWVEEAGVTSDGHALPVECEWRAQSPGFPYGHDKKDPIKALARARRIVEERISEGFEPDY